MRDADKSKIELLRELERLREKTSDVIGLSCQSNQEEHKLRESEARLKAILDTTVDGIITIDQRGIVQSFNQAAERIFGFAAHEVIGQNVNMLMPMPFRAEHDDYLANYLHTGERKLIGIGRELIGLRKEGSTFPLDLAVSEVWVGNKRLFTGIVRDITNRKEAEEALRAAKDELEQRVRERTAELQYLNEQLQQEIKTRRQAEESLKVYTEQLEQSNRNLKDFAFVASHDLQEPLRKIRAFGDRLKVKFRVCVDEEGKDYLDRMQNAAERMQNLVEALLNYSRVTSRAEPFTSVDLNQLIQEVAIDLEVLFEQTGATLLVDDLPIIEADSNQLRQLFQNLIINAVKFHGEEPPLVKIYWRLVKEQSHESLMRSPPEDRCKIFVEDNGIGFDEKYLDRIFMPFQRLHGQYSSFEGTGIGLAICRRIVQRHGGTITAKSSPGSGSTFMMSLPVKQSRP